MGKVGNNSGRVRKRWREGFGRRTEKPSCEGESPGGGSQRGAAIGWPSGAAIRIEGAPIRLRTPGWPRSWEARWAR